jgi:hypothetical protein
MGAVTFIDELRHHRHYCSHREAALRMLLPDLALGVVNAAALQPMVAGARAYA